MKLAYIAAGFGIGLVLYPWMGGAFGTLSLTEEAGRQVLLLGVTLFIAGHMSGQPSFKRIPLWVPGLIVFLSCMVLRQSVLLDLPFVPGDEDEYLFQASIFARGRVAAPAPEAAHLFWAPGLLIHDGQWFGHHQPGHSVLLALGRVVGAAWIVPALTSGLTVFLLALTVQRLAGSQAGLLAALLAMTSPMILLTGASMVSESSSLFLVALVFWLLIARPAGDRRSAHFAGIVMGFLLNTRLLVGVGVLGVGAILSDARSFKRLLPGVLGGLVVGVLHNMLTSGKPLILPFQLYEPHALGFKPSFGLGRALAHVIRNTLLLNFWLLGWPISFLLLRRGTKEASLRIRIAGWLFIGWLAVAYFFYWHPGQVATGPLRFHEATFPLLLFSALGWESATKAGSFLARYVPLAMVFAVLSFLPVREAVVSRFVRTALEERRALEKIGIGSSAVLLCRGGNLFHYPVNDPWLKADGKPLFAWADEPETVARLFPKRSQLWLQSVCSRDSCTWRLSAETCSQRERGDAEPRTTRSDLVEGGGTAVSDTGHTAHMPLDGDGR